MNNEQKRAGQFTRPFVSREEELRILQEQFAWVLASKKPRLVLVDGDFGVGKTTLIDRFLSSLIQRDQEILIGTGKCSLEDKDNGRTPFVQIFNSLLPKNEGDLLTNQKIRHFVWKVAPGWADIFTFGVASAVATTIDEGIELLSPEKSSKAIFGDDQIFAQFTNAVAEITKDKRVIIFIDDLQWADESSLRLLFYFMNNLPDRPAMVISTYRTYDIHHSPHKKLFGEIRSNLALKGISYELHLEKGVDVFDYVRKRYGAHAIPSSLLRSIQEKSDGLAIYVVELFNLWEQKKIIYPTKRLTKDLLLWDILESIELEIPQGIKEILKERIKLLTVQLKAIITSASVEGEDFSAQVVSELLQINNLVTYDELDILEHEYNLINEKGAERIGSISFDLYRFAHRFIREYIYKNEFSVGKRRELHHMMGICLEKICDDPKLVAAKLARHFREAGEKEKAIKYMLLAAQMERERFSWAECQNWCLQGLVMLEALSKGRQVIQVDLLELLSDCYHFTSKYEKAIKTIREAIAIGEELGLDPTRLVYLCGFAVETCELLNKYNTALIFIEKGEQIISEANLDLCESIVYLHLGEGLIWTRRGEIDRALVILKTCVDDAKTLYGDTSTNELLANAYNDLGVLYSVTGQYHTSCLLFEKASQIMHLTGNLYLEAVYLVNLLGDLFWVIDDARKLEELANQAQTIARQIGDLDTQAFLYSAQGSILLAQGKYNDSIVVLKKSIETVQQLDNIPINSSTYADLAVANLSLGNIEEAYAHAQKSLQLASRGTEKGCALDSLAMVEFARGNQEKALTHFKIAISTLKRAKADHFAVITQRHFAEMLIQCNRKEEGIKLLQESLQIATNIQLAREVNTISKILRDIVQDQ